MGITFREAIAEVELGLTAGDQLPDIATTGLLEGCQSAALARLAGQLGEPYDPIEVERLWSAAMQELGLPPEGRTASAKILVRAYARLVACGELPPQLGASKIAGVHRIACRVGCAHRAPGDCIGVACIIELFHTHDLHGYFNRADYAHIDAAILDECRRLADVAGV